MDPSLHADFGRAALPGFTHAALDLVKRQIVGLAAQILACLAFREGAELAPVAADVGVVDVAIHDIADGVSVHPRSELVGCSAYGGELISARTEQPHDLRFGQRLAAACLGENSADFTAWRRAAGCDGQREIRRRRAIRHARRPAVSAGKTDAVDPVEQRRAQSRVDPALHLTHVRRINRQTLDEFLARGVRRTRQHAQMRPGRLRIDVIGSHR